MSLLEKGQSRAGGGMIGGEKRYGAVQHHGSQRVSTIYAVLNPER